MRLRVTFPTPAAVLKSNSLLPGKGRLSNARGMPGRGGGMLRLQIDRCIKPWVPCERAAILPRINGTLVQSSSWEVSASLRKTSQDHHPRHRTWKPWTDSQTNLRFALACTCVDFGRAQTRTQIVLILHRNSTFGSPLFRNFRWLASPLDC